ncbi:site-specific integrase [bacterium D16-51]|nr:site-specific integrase [bacterium D16-59]RKI55423.1 site-specific integrase [bacterium D16-51]
MFDMELRDYTNWDVQSVFKRSDRGKYAYRVVLYFKDGTKRKKMYSGFATKKEAEDARKFTMGELANGTFIINDHVRLKDFLEYWLEYEIRKRAQSSNTYDSYSNIVRNHITPFMGSKKLTEINKGDVQRLYKDRAGYSKSIARLVKTVMNVSLRYALSYKLINTNPAEGIELPKTVERKPYHTRNIDTAKTLDMGQILLLLEESRKTPIHMQVLFNVLMGLRRQEINAVKYSDIDYVNRTLSVERQLGKELDRTPYGKTKGMTKCELPLKTPSSRRILPIPDYVFEAILEERKKYEKWGSRRKSVFHDDGYICCSNYSGKPRSKDFHWRHYKELLKRTGLPDIRWHDLRSTYCTLLLNNDFSPEAVSRLMGHAGELITIDVYGDNTNIIPEEIPELISYMDEVMPKKTLQGIDSETDGKGVLDTLIDMEEFLPEKAVKSDV